MTPPRIPFKATLQLLSIAVVLLVYSVPAAFAQVHYYPDGRPWKQRARGGPDAKVPGWFYNLGPTGMRVELIADAPEHLLVRYVFEDSPAHRKVKVGDVLVAARGKNWKEPHVNGYGMDKFGPDGPLFAFAKALEASQSKAGKGRLDLVVVRAGKRVKVSLTLGTRHGSFSKNYPADCARSERILDHLLEYLMDHQQGNGSFGNPVQNTFAPLALLSSGKRKHVAAVKRNVRYHASNTRSEDSSSLINWRYMTAGIVMSEYYLATKDRWVIEELEEVYAFLTSSQYMWLEQINPKVRESHPGAYPRDAQQQAGGWGHNPGFEGYGPIAMLTGQGALTFALMQRCGIEVDRERHDAAYDFLERGSGRNGYVWYGDEAAGQSSWADMGRTGAAGIANWLSPYKDRKYKKRAHAHAAVIAEHPESFPDTHASPILGMGYAAVAAHVDAGSFRQLMDASRWWFILSECVDGSFYYQPNRDNSGYGSSSRMAASAVTAFIFSLPQGKLAMTAPRSSKR